MTSPGRFLDALTHLRDREHRIARWRERWLAAPPDALVSELGVMLDRCLLGEPSGLEGVIAFASALLDLQGDAATYDATRAIYEATEAPTQDGAREATPRAALVRALLRDLPPHRAFKGRKPAAPRWERDVTLGEKKSMARGSNRRHLERLLLESDPRVVEQLCINPRLSLQDVLVMVTLRPSPPTSLAVIARSRWLDIYEVRHALVHNPFCRAGLSLRLLPSLRFSAIEALAHIGDVHPALCAFARDLVARRAAQLGVSSSEA